MNSIQNLLDKSFSTFSLDEKLQIKELGRPLPDMDIKRKTNYTSASKERPKKFNRAIYLNNNWVCGCDKKHAFFCFPCVLFGGDADWAKDGVKDIGHIWARMRRHEDTQVHIDNIFSFSLIDKSYIINNLNSTYIEAVTAYNKYVDKNRYVLNVIINSIRFGGAQNLVLQSQNESGESTGRGVFRELIDFTSHFDEKLKQHFSNLSIFNERSKVTRNELLEYMFDVYHEEVAREIKGADYVALIIDETTEITNELQFVIILRYVVSGKPVERFWSFVNPVNHNAVSVADCIFREINPLIGDTSDKLIAYSYGGVSTMSSSLSVLQKIIKKKYQLVNYVHCSAHDMNMILNSAASVNQSARLFFSQLSGLCTFFSSSPQRTKVLDETVQKRPSHSSGNEWNFHSRGINTVYYFRKYMLRALEHLGNNMESDSTTLQQAGGYMLVLKSVDFIFWLTVFYKIVPHVEWTLNQMQIRDSEQLDVEGYLQKLENEIKKIRDNVDKIIADLYLELLKEDKQQTKAADLFLKLHAKIPEEAPVSPTFEGDAWEVGDVSRDELIKDELEIGDATIEQRKDEEPTGGGAIINHIKAEVDVDDDAPPMKKFRALAPKTQIELVNYCNSTIQQVKNEEIAIYDSAVQQEKGDNEDPLENGTLPLRKSPPPPKLSSKSNESEATIICDSTNEQRKEKSERSKKNGMNIGPNSRILASINKKTEVLQICDSIVQQVKTRFSFNGHLVAAHLLSVQKFAEYSNRFPDTFFDTLVNLYHFLQQSKLRRELKVIYSRQELRRIPGPYALLSLILREEMCDTFAETLKLLKVLMTFPEPIVEDERGSPMLEKIKRFLKNTVKEERLSALGMLSTERIFLNNIDNFNKRVIDLFTTKSEHRTDFIYRTV